MKYDFVLHENVVLRLEAAVNWYDEQQVGLGDDFIEEFKILLDYIGQMPFGFAIAFGDYRQVMLKRFPFVILYKVEGKTIEISNLIHAKQHPGKRKGK